MVLVCAPTHRLAACSTVEIGALDGERMIGFENGLTIRREIDYVLHERHVGVEVVMEFDNIETIKRAIEIDAGIGLLPEPTVVREVETGALAAVPLEGVDLVRPLGIIHRRGRELTSTASRFIELLQREAECVESTRRGRRPTGGEASAAASSHSNGNSKRGGHAEGREAPRRPAEPAAR